MTHASARRRLSVRLHVRVSLPTGTAATWGDVASSSHACEATSDAANRLCDFLDVVLPPSWHESATLHVQGVQPPLDAPLQALHTHFHGPDGFMHVCVHLTAITGTLLPT